MQNSRALVVACNNYRRIDASGRWDLRGCVADAQDWIRWYKFKGVQEVRVLLDFEATSQAILDGCRWLHEGLWTREGKNMSPVIGAFRGFTFSGHGTLYKGRPALVPTDLDSVWSNALTYPRLGAALSFPEGTAVSLIIDACHSGERVRGDLMSNCSKVFGEEKEKPRFIPPPASASLFGAESWMEVDPTQGSRELVAAKPDSFHHISSPDIDVALTGCLRQQTSADAWIDGAYHGAFTYSLMRVLEETQGGISYSQLVESSAKWLKTHGYSQIPQYAGPPEYEDLQFMAIPKVTTLDGKPDAQ